MTKQEIDKIVYTAIKTIEKEQNNLLKANLFTIVDFLNGEEKNLFAKILKKHKKIFGSAFLTVSDVEKSCMRLQKQKLIVTQTNDEKTVYFKIQKRNFLDTLTATQKKLAQQICQHVTEKYPFLLQVEKEMRYNFILANAQLSDAIPYSWMWFVKKEEELIFRYKISPFNHEKESYQDNQIFVNQFQLKTIINIIDWLVEMQNEKIKRTPPSIQINFADFLVKVFAFNCVLNHNVELIQANINVLKENGTVLNLTTAAGYCSVCKCYFILESDYEKLRTQGVLLCQQISEKAYRQKGLSIMTGEDLKPESLLHQCGYNVQSSKNELTAMQRQEILRRVIDHGLYNVNAICSHLDWLIERNKKIANRDMRSAIEKWSADRRFILSYYSPERRSVTIKSINIKQ